MKWIKGNSPKKTKFSGICNSRKALIRRMNGQMSIEHWLGDRWTNEYAGANLITHYMWINKVR